MVFIRGLSPNSATVTKIHAQRTIGRRKDKPNTVAGPKATQRAFDALFKPRPESA